MAKKVVATLKKGDSAQFTKVIKMVKGGRNGAYTFEEKIVNKELSNEFFK